MPGKIVLARAQVRITLRSFPRLSVSIFACSLASIYGPFFDDLTIMILRDLSGIHRGAVTLSRPPPIRRTATNDHGIRALVIARPLKGRLTPLGLGLATNRRLALAATMWMVARVHYRAAHRRAFAHVTTAAGFADFDIFMFDISDLTERRHAIHMHPPHFARRKADLRVIIALGHQLGGGAGQSDQLTAAALAQLHIVNLRAGRNVAKRQRVPVPD